MGRDLFMCIVGTIVERDIYVRDKIWWIRPRMCFWVLNVLVTIKILAYEMCRDFLDEYVQIC